MAARHEQAVAFGATKTQVGATFGQMDVADGRAIGGENANTVEFFGLSAA